MEGEKAQGRLTGWKDRVKNLLARLIWGRQSSPLPALPFDLFAATYGAYPETAPRA